MMDSLQFADLFEELKDGNKTTLLSSVHLLGMCMSLLVGRNVMSPYLLCPVSFVLDLKDMKHLTRAFKIEEPKSTFGGIDFIVQTGKCSCALATCSVVYWLLSVYALLFADLLGRNNGNRQKSVKPSK